MLYKYRMVAPSRDRRHVELDAPEACYNNPVVCAQSSVQNCREQSEKMPGNFTVCVESSVVKLLRSDFIYSTAVQMDKMTNIHTVSIHATDIAIVEPTTLALSYCVVH